MVRQQKNLWVAAGDGDLERIRELIEQHGLSPNAPDSFTYTPMHAAASYGQLEVLEYLIAQGGDVNVTDGDGDTPLYTVEDVQTADWLIQHGAVLNRRNNEGVSPIEHLDEDFPAVAAYLRTMLNPTSSGDAQISLQTNPSQHSQNVASELLTSSLMDSVQDIMDRAEREGRDPEEELRAAVSRTVLEGVVTGYQMSEDVTDRREGSPETNGVKRPRTNGHPTE